MNTPIIIDGKKVADEIALDLKERVLNLNAHNFYPKLNVFTSTDPASQVYVRNKVKRGTEIGIEVNTIPVKNPVDFLKAHNAPFIIQLPTEMNSKDIEWILNKYSSEDMDGFGERNLGKLFKGNSCIQPCTPKGIIRLLKHYEIDLVGKNVTVIGRSNIVGKPLMFMLENENATVTLCHSRTRPYHLMEFCDNADIIISAVGKENVLKDWKAHRNQILIDVGINRNSDGKICGDFSSTTVESCCGYTPVPGGVGPMTVVMLMENVVEYYEKHLT